MTGCIYGTSLIRRSQFPGYFSLALQIEYPPFSHFKCYEKSKHPFKKRKTANRKSVGALPKLKLFSLGQQARSKSRLKLSLKLKFSNWGSSSELKLLLKVLISFKVRKL